MKTATKRINALPQASEHDHQVALFAWRDTQLARYPDLEWMFAIPNGAYRDIRTAARSKREGQKAGVWDIFLPVYRKPYHGLWIEMKAGRNKLSEQQKAFSDAVIAQKFCCLVMRSWEDAAQSIESYLKHEFS